MNNWPLHCIEFRVKRCFFKSVLDGSEYHRVKGVSSSPLPSWLGGTFSPWWVFVISGPLVYKLFLKDTPFLFYYFPLIITVIIAIIPSNWFTREDALEGVCRESAKAVFDLSQIPLIFIPAFSSDFYLVAPMAEFVPKKGVLEDIPSILPPNYFSTLDSQQLDSA